MKHKISVLMVTLMLAVCMLGATGCNNLFIDTGEEIETDKTQLYVFNYNGGVGRGWLDEAAERFEEKYANTSFEEGKTGVQIIVDPKKINRADLESELEGSSVSDVYFAEHTFYASWAQQGLLLDISDIVTGELTEFGDTGSIEDKLSAEKQAMLKSVGGKYYGLPHYEGFQGVNYNVKLFDEKKAYFNTNGTIIGELQNPSGADATKSAGPDGNPGNGDDGLPASLEQFAYLCEFLVSVGVKPFVWTGQYNEYFNILLDALTTSVLGRDAAEVLYSFNGNKTEGSEVVSRVITGFNGDTPIVGTTKINETTGYLLWQREELYYVLDFAQQIFNNAWYYSESTNGSYDHMMAQEDFVNGGKGTHENIAMLIDGNYWEKEASDAIARSERDFKYNYANDSNFAWMPLPTTVKGNTGDSAMTLKDATATCAFIHAKVPENRKALAKKFLQFCYSDAELKNFTLSTGMTRDLDYELTDAEKKTLSKYSQSMIAYKESADIVNTASTSTVFHANEEILTNTFWRTKTNTTYDRPHVAFFNGNATAKDFFLGLRELHKRDGWIGENRNNFDYHDFETEENITPVNQ